MDTTTPTAASIVLVPGHWLGAWAWDAVAADLRGRGHHVTAVTLPGLDPDDPHRASTTVAQQADALRSAVATATADGSAVVLVAHSGAGYPTSVLLDRDPAAVARVIYVDSGPSADGSAVDASVPPETEEVPLPPFDQLPASLDGLGDDDLKRFRERAVPEPGPVMRETVRLHNDSRRDVPSTIIASSYPAEVMMQMAREGHPMMAEVATLRDLELVDLPTGHWPMWSRPADLASAIANAAGSQDSHAVAPPSVGGPCESGPMTKEVQITFDCADPAGLAAFWAEVLGYQVQPPPDGFDSWDAALEAFGVPRDEWNSRSAILPIEGPHPRVFFQRVPEGRTVKNRVHLDVRVAPGLDGDERMSALETEANRLEALGATRAYRVEPDKAAMESGFITMHDPESNEFCLD